MRTNTSSDSVAVQAAPILVSLPPNQSDNELELQFWGQMYRSYDWRIHQMEYTLRRFGSRILQLVNSRS
jgi:hypothetical protein